MASHLAWPCGLSSSAHWESSTSPSRNARSKALAAKVGAASTQLRELREEAAEARAAIKARKEAEKELQVLRTEAEAVPRLEIEIAELRAQACIRVDDAASARVRCLQDELSHAAANVAGNRMLRLEQEEAAACSDAQRFWHENLRQQREIERLQEEVECHKMAVADAAQRRIMRLQTDLQRARTELRQNDSEEAQQHEEALRLRSALQNAEDAADQLRAQCTASGDQDATLFNDVVLRDERIFQLQDRLAVINAEFDVMAVAEVREQNKALTIITKAHGWQEEVHSMSAQAEELQCEVVQLKAGEALAELSKEQEAERLARASKIALEDEFQHREEMWALKSHKVRNAQQREITAMQAAMVKKEAIAEGEIDIGKREITEMQAAMLNKEAVAETEVEIAKGRIQELEDRICAMLVCVEVEDAKFESSEAKIELVVEELRSSQEEFVRANHRENVLQQEIAQIRVLVTQLQDEISDSKTRHMAAEADAVNCRDRAADCQEEIAQLQTVVTQLQDEMSDSKSRHISAEQQSVFLKCDNEQYEMQSEELLSEIQELSSELQELQSQVTANYKLVRTVSEERVQDEIALKLQAANTHSEMRKKEELWTEELQGMQQTFAAKFASVQAVAAEECNTHSETRKKILWTEELQGMQKTFDAKFAAVQAVAAEECKVLRGEADMQTKAQGAAVERCNILEGQLDIRGKRMERLESQIMAQMHEARNGETKAVATLDEERAEMTRLCFSITQMEAEATERKNQLHAEVAQLKTALVAKDEAHGFSLKTVEFRKEDEIQKLQEEVARHREMHDVRVSQHQDHVLQLRDELGKAVKEHRQTLAGRDAQLLKQAAEFRGAFAGEENVHREEALQLREALTTKDSLFRQVKDEIAKLQIVVESKNERIDELLGTIKSRDDTILQLRSVAATTDNEYRAILSESKYHKEEVAHHHGEAAKLRESLASKARALTQLDVANAHQYDEVSELLAEIDAKEHRHCELANRAAGHHKESRQLQTALSSVETELADTQAQMRGQTRVHLELVDAKNALTAELLDCRAQHKEEVTQLHRQVASHKQLSIQQQAAIDSRDDQISNIGRLESDKVRQHLLEVSAKNALAAELVDARQEVTFHKQQSSKQRGVAAAKEDQIYSIQRLESEQVSEKNALAAELGDFIKEVTKKKVLLAKKESAEQRFIEEIKDLRERTNSQDINIAKIEDLLEKRNFEFDSLTGDNKAAEEKSEALQAETAEALAETSRLVHVNSNRAAEITRLKKEIEKIEYAARNKTEDLTNQTRDMQARADNIRDAALKQEAESLKILYDADHRGQELLRLVQSFEHQEEKCALEEQVLRDAFEDEQRAVLEERQHTSAVRTELNANAAALAEARGELKLLLDLSAEAGEEQLLGGDLDLSAEVEQFWVIKADLSEEQAIAQAHSHNVMQLESAVQDAIDRLTYCADQVQSAVEKYMVPSSKNATGGLAVPKAAAKAAYAALCKLHAHATDSSLAGVQGESTMAPVVLVSLLDAAVQAATKLAQLSTAHIDVHQIFRHTKLPGGDNDVQHELLELQELRQDVSTASTAVAAIQDARLEAEAAAKQAAMRAVAFWATKEGHRASIKELEALTEEAFNRLKMEGDSSRQGINVDATVTTCYSSRVSDEDELMNTQSLPEDQFFHSGSTVITEDRNHQPQLIKVRHHEQNTMTLPSPLSSRILSIEASELRRVQEEASIAQLASCAKDKEIAQLEADAQIASAELGALAARTCLSTTGSWVSPPTGIVVPQIQPIIQAPESSSFVVAPQRTVYLVGSQSPSFRLTPRLV